MEDKTNLINLFKYLNSTTTFSTILLEKDYYLTKILQRLSEKELNLVFKGGTCLNKCYLGFYRLSEDLDFISKEKPKNKTQARKLISKLKEEIFIVFEQNGVEVNKELGIGWKMINSKRNVPIGLEIIGKYNSVISHIKQTIKLEISLRGSLYIKTNYQKIFHLFVNPLGIPLLPVNKKIECIALEENFAEKIRALVTRKKPVIRDIYDINYILKYDKNMLSKKIINLAILKIQETKPKYSLIDLKKNINSINAQQFYIEEIIAVLKSDRKKISIQEYIKYIQNTFSKYF